MNFNNLYPENKKESKLCERKVKERQRERNYQRICLRKETRRREDNFNRKEG